MLFIVKHLLSPSALFRILLSALSAALALNPMIFFYGSAPRGPGSIAYLVTAFIISSCLYLVWLSIANRQIFWIPFWVTAAILIGQLIFGPFPDPGHQGWDYGWIGRRVLSVEFRIAMIVFGALTLISIPFLKENNFNNGGGGTGDSSRLSNGG